MKLLKKITVVLLAAALTWAAFSFVVALGYGVYTYWSYFK